MNVASYHMAMSRKGIRIHEFWIHLITWICFLSLPVSLMLSQWSSFQWHVLSKFALNIGIFYANYLVFAPHFLLKKKILQYVLISIGFVSLSTMLMVTISPMMDMDRMQAILQERENLPAFKGVKYAVPFMILMAFYLLGGTVALMKDFFVRDKLLKEKEVKKTETELGFLKNQLNPHFLFNSLNSIYSLVRNKSDEAPQAVITLSQLMRYMLYDAKQEKVLLKHEIEYIENYISLQRLRLSNSENVTVSIKGEYENKKIYPLLLISFIENAFKYGTNFKGITDVAVTIEVLQDKLLFRVNNFLGNYKKNDSSSGIGLDNIKNRLELLYPNSHHLSITSNEKRYFVDLELTIN